MPPEILADVIDHGARRDMLALLEVAPPDEAASEVPQLRGEPAEQERLATWERVLG